MREAQKPEDIDRLLANEPCHALNLSSATTFRRQGSFLVRDGEGEGWKGCPTRKLSLKLPMLAPVVTGQPFAIAERTNGIDLPQGLRRPVLANTCGRSRTLLCCFVLWASRSRYRSRCERTCNAFASCPPCCRSLRGTRRLSAAPPNRKTRKEVQSSKLMGTIIRGHPDRLQGLPISALGH